MKLTWPQLHLWRHYYYNIVRSSLELSASSLKHLAQLFNTVLLDGVGVVGDGMKKTNDDWLL